MLFLQIGHCFFTLNERLMHSWQNTCLNKVTRSEDGGKSQRRKGERGEGGREREEKHTYPQGVAAGCFSLSMHILHSSWPAPLSLLFFLLSSFAINTSGSCARQAASTPALARFFFLIPLVFTTCTSKSAFLLLLGLVKSTTSELSLREI